MKATGIVRRFDENGRFVLPMELRRKLELNTPDAALEVFTDGDSIVLRKYEPSCVFCGGMDGLQTFREKKICANCAEKIRILFEA